MLIETKSPLITKNVSTEIRAERMIILWYCDTNCNMNYCFNKPAIILRIDN